MNQIKYSILKPTDENIILLEQLRYNAYGFDNQELKNGNPLHIKYLKEGKYLAFGSYLNDQLIGGCYISNSHNSLYIEELFISKQHQKTSLHLGTNLLLHILKNKDKVEEYFKTKLNYSYLEPRKNTETFYENLGYKETSNFFKKRI